MSSTKRQSSWQEDIARNFSRLFLRSKSQDKTESEGRESSLNVKENELHSSETKEEDLSQELVLDLAKGLSQAARASEGEGDGNVLGDGGGGGGGSLPQQYSSRPLPGLSPFRPPAAPEPGAPTPPLDAFFRKLGSFFHLPVKADSGSADPRQPGAAAAAGAEEEEEEEEEEEVAAVAANPEPTGMTWAAKEIQEFCEPTGRPPGEADGDCLCQEGREAPVIEPSHTAPQPATTLRSEKPQEECRHSDLQGRQHMFLNQVACEEATDERQRLAFTCPPVVTYGTYRGLIEIQKMRKRHHPQVGSSIAVEEETSLFSVGEEKGGLLDTSTVAHTVESRGAAACSTLEPVSSDLKVTLASERDLSSDASLRPCRIQEESLGPSALPQEQSWSDPATVESQTMDSTAPISSAVKDSFDMQPYSPDAVDQTKMCPAGSSGGKTARVPAGVSSADTEAGTEHAETLSLQKDRIGSPSTAGAELQSEAACTPENRHPHQLAAPSVSSAAASCFHSSQFTERCISLSGSQEAEDGEGLVPVDKSADWQLAARQNGCDLRESESESIADEMGCLEDTGTDVEAFHSESRRLVDNILRNALVALQKIESSELDNTATPSASRESIPVLPAESEESRVGPCNPACLLENSLLEHNSSQFPGLVEQAIASSRSTMDGSRSTQSSRYESIVGSDKDIRNNPGLTCELPGNSGSQGEQCPGEKPAVTHPSEVSGSYVVNSIGCHEREINQQSNGNIEPVVLTVGKNELDANGSTVDVLYEKNNSVSQSDTLFEKRAPGRDGDHFLKVNYVSEGPWSDSGKQNKDKAPEDLSIEAKKEAIRKELHLTRKAKIGAQQDMLLSRSGSSQSSEEVTVRYLQTDGETGRDCIGNEVWPNSPGTALSNLDIAGHTEQSWMSDLEEQCDTKSEDQSFVLVEGHLAAIIEDETDSGGEDTASQQTGPGYQDTTGKEENPKDSLSHALQSVLSMGNEDKKQWSTKRVYCCSPCADQGPETPGHCGGESFLDSANGRTCGPNTFGKGPSPVSLLLGAPRGEASGPLLHRFHEMEFHENDHGFAIINEEEEADAVFVNDTGVSLSPTLRRSKGYPFSLSPIYEEESVREDMCQGGLLEPPAMEEDLRSVEQQATSILSLLQSVSERLQSSAFSDTYQDSSEDPSALVRHPLWDCYSDKEEDAQSIDGDKNPLMHLPCGKPEEVQKLRPVNDDGSSLCLTDKRDSAAHAVSPPQDVQQVSTVVSNCANVGSTPFYEYLKSSGSLLPQFGTESSGPHAVPFLCQDTGGPSASATMSAINKSLEHVTARPTEICLYSGVTFSGEEWRFMEDVEDMAGVTFLHGGSVRVLRGCWLMYREPGYRGSCVVLEEGKTVLSHNHGLASPECSPTAITIGSIRRVVKDDSLPEIQVRPQGMVGATPECLNTEVRDLENRGEVCLSSLTVESGCWLAYGGAGFSGSYTVLEVGRPPAPGPDGTVLTCVKSLRPLRMGGLKVRRPTDPKVVVYERPCFCGQSCELEFNMPVLGSLQGAASLRVIGGGWVGYSMEGYKGRQYFLEEGECRDCVELGGSDHVLLSFRFLQADFEPTLSLLAESDLAGAKETDIVDSDVPDLAQAGPAGGAASICVKSGLWVAYSEPSFCGDQYVLEKGIYRGALDWGGTSGKPMSIRPVRLELSSGGPKFLLRAYSQPDYHGNSQEYKSEGPGPLPFVPMSFKVVRGSWLLFDEESCAGNQFVLGVGLYRDLISCGCAAVSVKSLRPIPYNFSDPSLSLFSLGSFQGLETVTVTAMDCVQNFFAQSLRVNSGQWVVYEYGNFKGRQMLLLPGEFPAWADHSGWDTIGSLQPLRLPKVCIQVRSRACGSLLTAEEADEGSSAAEVYLSPVCSLDTQRWVFTKGLLKSKASKACLSVIGGKASPGARVALWHEHGRTHQKWSLNENGTISSHLNHSLVLDLKGGTGFDKDHLVASDFTADRITQYWDVEVI